MDERVVSKMEGKTNFSRRLKQAWPDWPWPLCFTTDLCHWFPLSKISCRDENIWQI